MSLIPLSKGLLTSVSPQAAPPDTCVVLDNLVVNETGQLETRPGTKVVLDSSAIFYVKQLATTTIIISVESGSIYVRDLDGVVVSSYQDVYDNDVDLNFNDVDDVDFYSVVIFGRNCNPIQINLVEYTYYHVAPTSTVQLDNWNPIYMDIFRNNRRVSGVFSGTNPISVAYGTDGDLTLLHCTYSVWVPGQYYFGNEMFNSVTKSASLKVVQVPQQLNTDLTETNSPLLNVYINNDTTFSITTTPRLPSDVAFSDGQEYDYAPTNSIKFSPYYLTFGQKLYNVKFDLSVLDVDTVNNSLVIQNHAIEEGMLIKFYNEAPSGITLETDYVVVDSSAGTFKLETLNGTPVTFSSQLNTTRPPFSFNTFQILENGTVSVPGATLTGKRKYKVISSVLLPTSLENNANYYITASAGIVTFYTEAEPSTQINVERLKTTSFQVSSVDYLNNELVIPGHGYFNSQPVAIINASDLVSPLLTNTVYYVYVATADRIKLFYDKDLQNVIDFSVASVTSINLNHTVVDLTTNTINVANHNFNTGDAVIIEDTRPTVLPLTFNTIYYVQRLSSSSFRLFYDINLVNLVDLYVPSAQTRTFTGSNIHATPNNITITSHGLVNGQAVMFQQATLFVPITSNTIYYIKVVDSNTVEFHTNSSLTSIVDIDHDGTNTFTLYLINDYSVQLKATAVGTGLVFLTDAWGDIKLVPEYESGYIQTVNYSTALLARRRKVKFNSSALRVLVDGVLWQRVDVKGTVNSYFITNASGTVTPVTTPVTSSSYITFESAPVIGVSASSLVEFVDAGIGSAMSNSFTVPSTYNNRFITGSCLVKYGYADYFSFTEVPDVAVVSNNRLFLGRNILIVASNVLDSFYNDRYYNNFTIDDRLEGTEAEPYYFILSNSGSVVSMLEFQNNLFIFTTRAIFRLNPTGATSYVLQNVANQGVSSRNCVTKLQSFIVYANEYGVYLLNSEVQELYYALELSNTIGSVYKKHKCTSLVFDPTRDCLYSFGEEQTYCYNVLSKAWSTFRYPFKVVQGFYADEVYITTEDKLLSFTSLPLDKVVTGSYSIINGNLWSGITLVEAKVEYSTTSSVSSRVVMLATDNTTVVQDLLNRVVAAPVTHTLNWVSLDSNYGLEIPCLVVSGATAQENLAVQGTHIFASVSFSRIPGVPTEFTYGVLFGNDPVPEVIKDVVSKNDIPPFSNHAVLKEGIQGVANSYQFILYSKSKVLIDGYDLLANPGVVTYYSGGN